VATTLTTQGISDLKNKIRINWPWPGSTTRDVMIVLGVALLLRLIFISQLAATPDFSNPVGDAQDYLERTHEILQGDFLGSRTPFLSAPLYPIFMALCLGVSEFNFFFLRLSQIIIGAVTCVLIYLMTRRRYLQEPAAALLAGLSAAAYAPLAYYDGDLLAIFMTTAAIALHGVTLMAARYKPWPMALVSGLALGLAATDKLNLLLLLPLAGGYLFNGVTLSRTRPAGNFVQSMSALMLGMALVILPITINNYSLEKDFVIVSSNAGANLFIGNHEKAQGMFQLPPGMSLTNIDLHAQAEQETGRKLKPSQASAYWGGKAWGFLRSHPDKALALYWKKFRLIWNGYEIPNHLDMYLIQQQYAPILKFLVVGFGLAAPLALLGLAIDLTRGPSAEEKLCLAYLVTITLFLLPFFITARYRLPMVPFLLALAGCGNATPRLASTGQMADDDCIYCLGRDFVCGGQCTTPYPD
jgi:4-amino-4-deoxy-L-arabinose transferase-like glycosyltransferase